MAATWMLPGRPVMLWLVQYLKEQRDQAVAEAESLRESLNECRDELESLRENIQLRDETAVKNAQQYSAL